MEEGRIKNIKTKVIDIPFKTPWQTSAYFAKSRPTLLVQIETKEGVYGYGEASPSLVFNAGTPETQEIIIKKYLSGHIVGKSVFNVSEIIDIMDHVCKGNGGAKSAIDQACWDASGKLLKKPVCYLLGGQITKKVPQVKAVGAHALDKIIQIIQSMLVDGYDSLKIKVGVDVKKEVKLISKIRENFGDIIKIRVDANQAFDLNGALKFAEQITPFSIECFEQPLADWDIKGMKFMRKKTDIPIMADESCSDLFALKRLIDEEAADIFNLKIVKMGGIFRAKQALAIVESAGKIAVAGGFEAGIGTSASLHLSCTSPVMKIANEHFVSPNFEWEIITEPFKIEGGGLMVPEGPGLGFGDPTIDFCQ